MEIDVSSAVLLSTRKKREKKRGKKEKTREGRGRGAIGYVWNLPHDETTRQASTALLRVQGLPERAFSDQKKGRRGKRRWGRESIHLKGFGCSSFGESCGIVLINLNLRR
jgi:hypothetical protein